MTLDRGAQSVSRPWAGVGGDLRQCLRIAVRDLPANDMDTEDRTADKRTASDWI